MVKILAFPGIRKAKATSKDALSASTAELPRVTAAMDGSFVISSPVPSEKDANTGDWTNQELADLYRVEALLVQANIRISSSRGLTDEDDPWFVFCREDGDVFVHLARIGGTYLLDSPGLGEVLEGSDFPELIGRFVRQVAAKAAPDNNVVTLRPRMLHDQTVRLHPAVMLAALVWSLYLASDDFVGVAHSVEEIAGREGHFPPIGGLEKGEGAIAPETAISHLSEQVQLREAAGLAPSAERATPVLSSDGKAINPVDSRTATASANIAASPVAQSVAASLAVVAVSYGFYHFPDDDDGQVSDGKPMALLPQETVVEHAATSETREASAPHLTPEGDTGSPQLWDMAQKVLLHELKLPELAIPLPVLNSAIAEEIRNIQDSVTFDTPALLLSEAVPVDVPSGRAEASNTHVAAATTVATGSDGSIRISAKEETVSATEAQTVLKLVSQYVGSVSDYKIGNLSVTATIDVANIDKVLSHIGGGEAETDSVVTVSVASSITITADGSDGVVSDSASLVKPAPASPPPPISSTPQYAHYDDKAKSFVSSFIQEAGNIEMVQFNSEIVLVDMTALDEPTDHAYSRSWVTDDGHVISTIGHIQDFIQYGMA